MTDALDQDGVRRLLACLEDHRDARVISGALRSRVAGLAAAVAQAGGPAAAQALQGCLAPGLRSCPATAEAVIYLLLHAPEGPLAPELEELGGRFRPLVAAADVASDLLSVLDRRGSERSTPVFLACLEAFLAGDELLDDSSVALALHNLRFHRVREALPLVRRLAIEEGRAYLDAMAAYVIDLDLVEARALLVELRPVCFEPRATRIAEALARWEARGARGPARHLWFVTPLALEDVCWRLEAALGLPEPFERDAENVWEWGEAEAFGGRVDLNLSRRHDDGRPLPDEVMTLLVSGDLSALDLEDLGRTIAATIGASVQLGWVEYLGGEDFRYHAERELR